MAALLHDVGKVGVRTQTLTKPGGLDDDEWAEIREHPAIAASILSEIDYFAEIIPIISSHHERLDGQGYPNGSRGQEIPLGARMLAVADCFDAMTSCRAYRSGLGFEAARDELRRVAGTQLDGALVEALLSRVDAETLDKLTIQDGDQA